MPGTLGLNQVDVTPSDHDATAPVQGSGRILMGLFKTFERAAIPYCVLHGYDEYPRRISSSDVDCIISPEIRPGRLAALFHECRHEIGAEVVLWRGYYFVFAAHNPDGSRCFLHLDLGRDFELCHRLFYRGREVLDNRRRHGQFWTASTAHEFGSYLVKKIAKARLDDCQAQKLSDLYRRDPAGCGLQVARFWGGRSAALITAAAKSGQWESVQCKLLNLRSELMGRASRRHPARWTANLLSRLANKFRRLCRPNNGLSVIFLGPDGAGKSSVVEAVARNLSGAFPRTVCYGFPPAVLRRLLRRPVGPEMLPHALPPRSFLKSTTRALFYWLPYYAFGYYVTVRLALARSALVLHDRHLVDALVDPRRYRYGGPAWLLRFVWRLIAKPDLVVLLDAPTEVLQARKQEVPFEETNRQREAYLSLVRTMRNGTVVNSGRHLSQVTAEVVDAILRYQAARVAGRCQ